jgi:hypothetical protein
MGWEDIIKPTTENESFMEISTDKGIIIEHFATSKNLTVYSTMLPHCNIHNFT